MRAAVLELSVGPPLSQERERVPASSERTIQNVPSVAEQLGDLAGENRRVKCG